MTDTIIENYYLEKNYPSADKLHKILKKNNIVGSLSKRKEWFSKTRNGTDYETSY